jgi:hypothetical protein
MNRIPEGIDIYSDEYKQWKEEYLDDCGLYARHIINEELESEEEWIKKNY